MKGTKMENFECPSDDELFLLRHKDPALVTGHMWYVWHFQLFKGINVRPIPKGFWTFDYAMEFVINHYGNPCDMTLCHYVIRKATHADILAISEFQRVRNGARYEKAR